MMFWRFYIFYFDFTQDPFPSFVGKRAKKIASMTNVVNDLIRHKMLDDLENAGDVS